MKLRVLDINLNFFIITSYEIRKEIEIDKKYSKLTKNQFDNFRKTTFMIKNIMYVHLIKL